MENLLMRQQRGQGAFVIPLEKVNVMTVDIRRRRRAFSE